MDSPEILGSICQIFDTWGRGIRLSLDPKSLFKYGGVFGLQIVKIHRLGGKTQNSKHLLIAESPVSQPVCQIQTTPTTMAEEEEAIIARIITDFEETLSQNQTTPISHSTLLELESLLQSNDPDTLYRFTDQLSSKKNSLYPLSFLQFLAPWMRAPPISPSWPPKFTFHCFSPRTPLSSLCSLPWRSSPFAAPSRVLSACLIAGPTLVLTTKEKVVAGGFSG